MAEAVVTVALETIRDLLINEGEFLLGVKDQVEGLRDELVALGSFLKDANRRKHEDESVLTWVCQARLLAYRAEDVIEEYAIKVASKRGCGFTKVARRGACIVGEGIAIHKLGNEIVTIKLKIAELHNRLKTYGIDQVMNAELSPAAIERQQRARRRFAHEVDEYFVGMEDDVSKIVTWVTEDEESHRVISICGIGGLGKTTIARKVYHHRQVKMSFECFAWESVTQQCQVEMLLQNILIQILGYEGRDKVREMKDEDPKSLGYKGRDKVRKMKEKELVTVLYDELKNKKCFVVLDDIWKLEDWKSLSPAFPILEGSSKILLTTRKREVAQVAHLQHEPALLDAEDGWDLLTKIAFNRQEERANKLSKTVQSVESVGRDILRKCGGLPLAIAVLGGNLRGKDTLIEWEAVNNKIGTYVREKGGIGEVLAFSYDDLPSDLRPCFLYMGCFREDEDIDVIRLYQLWMAEGLIPSRSSRHVPKETLMDVASDFLAELISRNMVQPQERNEITNMMCCSLHDLVRELCLTKGQEEQFPKIQIGSIKNSTTNDTYIRTLIFNDRGSRCFSLKGEKFKRIRSLILDNCMEDDCSIKGKKLSKQIRDMIHLRYLSIQCSLHNGKLPSFIGDLQYLQTLNLARNYFLQLPNIFHKMKSLRCLYLPKDRKQSMFAKRLEFHGLNELEIVEGLHSRYDKFTVSEFINIRRFGATIRGYELLSTIFEELSSLSKLQSISITFEIIEEPGSELEKSRVVQKLLLCPHLHNLELHSPIGKFPRYEPHFWPDLVSLKLWNTYLEEDPMPFLQELPNLRELTMFKAYVGKQMYCCSKAFPKLTSLIIRYLTSVEIWRVDAGAFPKLTSLEIAYLENIEIWRVDAGAFPNLSTLRIWGRKSFEIVPDGLTSITSLTRIDMEYMPEEFKIKYGRVQNTNQ